MEDDTWDILIEKVTHKLAWAMKITTQEAQEYSHRAFEYVYGRVTAGDLDLDPPARLSYLYQAARHRYIEEATRTFPTRTYQQHLELFEFDEFAEDKSPEYEKLYRYISILRPRHRKIIEMTLRNYSSPEIGRILDLHPHTVRRHKKIAMQHIAQAYEDDRIEPKDWKLIESLKRRKKKLYEDYRRGEISLDLFVELYQQLDDVLAKHE